MRRISSIAVGLWAFVMAEAAAAGGIKVYAAGSLKAALGEMAQSYSGAGGAPVELTFGASGLLRAQIEAGDAPDLFASADMGHPLALARAGKTDGPPIVFARNTLCAIARDGLAVTTGSLLAVMLDPATRLGMSTPKADPSGDYALEVFDKAETHWRGAGERLRAKAQALTGGAQSERAPEGRSAYAWLMEQNKADLFLTYCTNARLAQAERPQLQVVALPSELATGAEYGLVVLKAAPEDAHAFARFISSPSGQAILAHYGFAAP